MLRQDYTAKPLNLEDVIITNVGKVYPLLDFTLITRAQVCRLHLG